MKQNGLILEAILPAVLKKIISMILKMLCWLNEIKLY